MLLEAEAFGILDNRHMKVAMLSALCTGRLYPPGVDDRATVRQEGLRQRKLPMTPKAGEILYRLYNIPRMGKWNRI
jgi:hypothetical protein